MPPKKSKLQRIGARIAKVFNKKASLNVLEVDEKRINLEEKARESKDLKVSLERLTLSEADYPISYEEYRLYGEQHGNHIGFSPSVKRRKNNYRIFDNRFDSFSNNNFYLGATKDKNTRNKAAI